MRKGQIKDIYSRNEDAPNYNGLRLEVDDPLDDLIIKIENTLFTNRMEVLGASEFGCSLDDLIFSLNNNEDMIRNQVGSQITTYCLNDENPFEVDVKVKFFANETRNGAFVDIIVNDQRVIGLLY